MYTLRRVRELNKFRSQRIFFFGSTTNSLTALFLDSPNADIQGRLKHKCVRSQ